MKLKKLLAAFTLLFCAGCSSKIESDITFFQFSQDYGLGGYCVYIIKIEDNKVIYSKEAVGMETDSIEKEIDKKALEDIQKIINDKEIYKWNGFDRYDKDVLDGSGFSLIVNYSNGERISANGYMKYPTNYREGADALLEYLNKLEN